MKLFDWIVLSIAVPFFLLNLYGYLKASSKDLVRLGLAEPNVKTNDIILWLSAILFVVWRVCG